MNEREYGQGQKEGVYLYFLFVSRRSPISADPYIFSIPLGS